MESESVVAMGGQGRKGVKRRRKGERAKFTRIKKHRNLELESEFEIKLEKDIKIEPTSDMLIEPVCETPDPVLESKEIFPIEIKQEIPEECPLIKSEPMDEEDLMSCLDVEGSLEAANERNTNFDCSDSNCTKCKEQQVAYCFLHFHECWFEDSRCIVCCDLSLHLVGENSHHCSDTTIKCVFCGRTFDELRGLQEHDCNTMISKEYRCSICPAKSTKIGAYYQHILFTHCGVNRLKCQQCLARFHNARALKRHMKMCHSVASRNRKRKPAAPRKKKNPDPKKATKRAKNSEKSGEKADVQTEKPSCSRVTEVQPPEIQQNQVNADEIQQNEANAHQVKQDEVEANEIQKNELKAEEEEIKLPSKEEANSDPSSNEPVALCERTMCTKCYDRAATMCLLEYHNCPVPSEFGSGDCEVCLQVANHFQLEEKERSVLHIGCSAVRCAFCITDFPDIAALKAHKCGAMSDNKCLHCGVIARTFLKLCFHLFYHFKIMAFKCHICGKSFVAKQRFLSHLRDHTLPAKFKCAECGIGFHKMREYKNHMSKHGSEKPHKCTKCPKSFNAGYQLVLHMETHAEKKPYPCTQCDRSFVKPRNLEHHEYTFHGTGGLQCKLCNRRVSCPIRYRNHMKYHDNATRYTCSDCGRGYASKSTLNRHVRIHTTEVITCDVEGCPYTTHYEWLLRSHKISHSGIKPQVCKLCPRGFYTKRSLVKHVAKWHTERESLAASPTGTTASNSRPENRTKEGGTVDTTPTLQTRRLLVKTATEVIERAKKKLNGEIVSSEATYSEGQPEGSKIDGTVKRPSIDKILGGLQTTRCLMNLTFNEGTGTEAKGGAVSETAQGVSGNGVDKGESSSERNEKAPLSDDSAKAIAELAVKVASLQKSLGANGAPVESVGKKPYNYLEKPGLPTRSKLLKTVLKTRVVSTQAGVITERSYPKNIIYSNNAVVSTFPGFIRGHTFSKLELPSGFFPFKGVMKRTNTSTKPTRTPITLKSVPNEFEELEMDIEESLPATKFVVSSAALNPTDNTEDVSSSTEITPKKNFIFTSLASGESASEKPGSWTTILKRSSPSPITFPLKMRNGASVVKVLRKSTPTTPAERVLLSPLGHQISGNTTLTMRPGSSPGPNKTFTISSKLKVVAHPSLASGRIRAVTGSSQTGPNTLYKIVTPSGFNKTSPVTSITTSSPVIETHAATSAGTVLTSPPVVTGECEVPANTTKGQSSVSRPLQNRASASDSKLTEPKPLVRVIEKRKFKPSILRRRP